MVDSKHRHEEDRRPYPQVIPRIAPSGPVPSRIRKLIDATPQPLPLKSGSLSQFSGKNRKLQQSLGGFRPDWLGQDMYPALTMPRLPRQLRELAFSDRTPFGLRQRLLAYELRTTLYPYSTIGKVMVGIGNATDLRWVSQGGQKTGEGSGVMVGRNLMLTAGHVAPIGRRPGDWWMKFIPCYDYGAEPLGSSFVESYYGYRGEPNDVQGDDMVVCKLYAPLGDATGWMGRYAWPNSHGQYKRHACTSVGYPGAISGGQIASVEASANIVDVDGGANGGLELECKPFASPGWSGGPLFAYIGSHPYPLVLGIVEGNETELSFWDLFTEDHTVATGGQLLLDLVAYGEANWRI
jgi:hypothetical protein